MLTGVDTLAHELLRGWSGLALDFTAVQAPMWVAMARGRAELRAFLAAPVLAGTLMVATGLGISLASPLLHAMHIASGGLVEFAIGGSIGGLLGYGGGRVLATPNSNEEGYVRGATVIAAAEAATQRGSRHERRRERGASIGVTLAGVPIPLADETKHFKLIGTTGAGKSTAITELLSGALHRGDRAVIADPDAGYMTRFFDARRGDVVLSPFEPGGAKWDLFGEIREEYDIDQLALALIPDHEGQDRSWRSYARTLFCAVTSQARAGGVSDVKELFELLVVAKKSELEVLVAGTAAQPFFEEHNDRMLDSVRSVLSSAVGALQHVARQESPPLSVKQWVRSGSGVLFMPYRAGQIAALRSTVSAWMRLGIFEAMTPPAGESPAGPMEDRKLWFVVDELDALGQIDGLKDALARLRKFGGRCVLGFQSVAQVSSTYGKGEAQTLVENCGNSLILRCSASEHGGTSQFASRLIGQREVVRISRSKSRRSSDLLASVTESEHRQIEPAVMDSEVERLPDLAGFLKLASSPDWLRVTLRLPEDTRQAAAGAPKRTPTAARPGSSANTSRQGSEARNDAPARQADVTLSPEAWEHE
ncbi:MAG TPA: type IV secretion system DNA-binding domain-containing protein [Steroidobacteraceae bacterium]|nr:type IV secretion system DNA-binding domain-containing protein [Steroidobacteraceae bacterium]